MTEIRYAEKGDRDAWFSLDRHLPESGFDEKIERKMAYVLLNEGSIIGVLRYNLFWDNTPFCTMLYITDSERRKYFGRQLTEHWESDMRARGYEVVMLSTQVDEEAQHFYRKLGYKDCGGFVIDVPGYEQPMEMMMIKDLRNGCSQIC